MAYVVLARKYRPQRFADVVGQEAVAETLKNAVRADRVAHAYLFAGPRGTGKTSMARILAKALNCARLEDGEPCDECAVCADIREGRHFDVDEFDAASNRKVEHAEALIQRVRNPRPYRADTKFRVFIVDEVHMMTDHAFSALLKTLEEPPAHVKFIFATTEPEKVLETILSRCQRFDFRRLSRTDVLLRLNQVCEREDPPIRADEAALRLIAARARGGLRDAVMLLDQVVAQKGPGVDEKAVRDALGLARRERILALLAAVGAGDVASALRAIAAIFDEGLDPAEVCGEALEALRGLMLAAALGGAEAAAPLLAVPEEAPDLAPLAPLFPLERSLYAIAAVAELTRRLADARDDRVLVELCFVKLARLGDVAALPELLERLSRLEDRLRGATPATLPESTAGSAPAPTPTPLPTPNPNPIPAPPPAQAPGPPPGPPTLKEATDAWGRLVAELAAANDPVGIYVDDATPSGLEGGALALEVARELNAQRIERDRARLEGSLARLLGGRPLGLRTVLKPEAPQTKRRKAPTPAEAEREDPDLRRAKDAVRGQIIEVRDTREVRDARDAREKGDPSR